MLGAAISRWTFVAAAARARLTDYFTPGVIARAERFNGLRYALGFSALGVTLVTLGLLAFGPGARRLGAWAERLRRWQLIVAALTAIVVVVPALLTLPFDVAEHLHEHAFGLTTQSVAGALLDTAKALGFTLLISVLAALGAIALARRLPRGWPVAVAAGGAALAFALVFLMPLVYEPAFSRFAPADVQVRARVLDIAAREGVRVSDVRVSDASTRTTELNAYVSGIGSSRRVVLFDTLLHGTPQREVDVVVAHELAHVKHDDVLHGTILGAAGVVAATIVIWLLLRWPRLLRRIGARDASDPRVIPFVAFFIAIASLVTAPLQNAVSRAAEARADRTAITVTAEPKADIDLQVDLARRDLSDLRPNAFVVWAFYTHPTTLQRIQLALDYAAAHPS